MRKKLLCLLFLFVAVTGFSQQDPQFSQYMFNHLSINPAYAGTKDALNVTLLARRQWTAIKGAPATNFITVEGPLKNKKVGLGLQLINDKIGPKTANGILFSYSYHLPLAAGRISMGLRVGWYNYAFRWNDIEYKDKADVYNTMAQDQKGVFTGDFGLYYYDRNFYWGLSTTHINKAMFYTSKQNADHAYLASHVFMPAGIGFQINDHLVINPSVLLKYASRAPVGADLNCNILFNDKIWVGATYRFLNSFAALVQFNITEKLKAGYAHDFGINKIGTAGGVSHELMISYDFNVYRTKMVTPRYL
jgi:type IX secretion system PorP/SprF family membrane protein